MILRGILGLMIMSIISMMMWIVILTPEKTLDGEYTQPFKYWTDDTYFQQNFIIKE